MDLKKHAETAQVFSLLNIALIPGDLSSGLAIPLPLSGHRGRGGTFSVKNRREVILFTALAVTPTQDISDRSQPGVYPDHMDDQKG